MNWISVEKMGLPDESSGKPFVVFCPTLPKQIYMGTFTTHGRGMGIRPAGERNYHFDNHVTHWAYIELPKKEVRMKLRTTEEINDPCPKCGTQLVFPLGGGVKCPRCSYWFCY